MEKIAESIAQIAAQAKCIDGGNVRDPASEITPTMMAGLTEWIASQPEPRPSVSDTIRQAVSEWLAQKGHLAPAKR